VVLIKPFVGGRYSTHQVADTMEAFASRAALGKIVPLLVDAMVWCGARGLCAREWPAQMARPPGRRVLLENELDSVFHLKHANSKELFQARDLEATGSLGLQCCYG